LDKDTPLMLEKNIIIVIFIIIIVFLIIFLFLYVEDIYYFVGILKEIEEVSKITIKSKF